VDIVTEQAPQDRDTSRERTLGDRAVVPDCFEELVFCNHAVRVMQQKLQDFKDLRLKGQDFSGFGDGEVALVDLYVGKPKDAAPLFHLIPRKTIIGFREMRRNP
jgi:hypothetical protein